MRYTQKFGWECFLVRELGERFLVRNLYERILGGGKGAEVGTQIVGRNFG